MKSLFRIVIHKGTVIRPSRCNILPHPRVPSSLYSLRTLSLQSQSRGSSTLSATSSETPLELQSPLTQSPESKDHEQALKKYTHTIDNLLRSGFRMKAYSTFKQMKLKGIIPTVQIYLAMIDMHCCLGNEKEVQDLYHEMLRNKIEPNDNVFLRILMFYNSRHDEKKIEEFIKEMKRRNMQIGSDHYFIFFQSLLRQKRTTEILSLFEELKAKGLITSRLLSLVVKAYAFLHDFKSVLKFLDEIAAREDSQNVLDWRLYTKLIKDASRYGTLEETLAIYKHMVSRKVNQNSLIRTSLLWAYGKEKKWFECLDHFSKWKKNGRLKPMNYITMIKLSGMNGHLNMAFDFFHQYIGLFVEKRIPDSADAFIALLRGCLANNAPKRSWEVVQTFIDLKNRNPDWKNTVCRKFIDVFVSRVLSDANDLDKLPPHLKMKRERFLQNKPSKTSEPLNLNEREEFVQFMEDCLKVFVPQ